MIISTQESPRNSPPYQAITKLTWELSHIVKVNNVWSTSVGRDACVQMKSYFWYHCMEVLHSYIHGPECGVFQHYVNASSYAVNLMMWVGVKST